MRLWVAAVLAAEGTLGVGLVLFGGFSFLLLLCFSRIEDCGVFPCGFVLSGLSLSRVWTARWDGLSGLIMRSDEAAVRCEEGRDRVDIKCCAGDHRFDVDHAGFPARLGHHHLVAMISNLNQCSVCRMEYD